MSCKGDESVLDSLILAYRINYRVLQEIQDDPWSHPDAVPEEILIDMALLWEKMIDYIPESHSLKILSMVYG